MNIKRAEEIINAYGKTMEQTASMTFGAPESLLPYNKSEIKEAIKSFLSHLQPDDQKTKDLLKVGYITLAIFIPDKKAMIAAKGQQALLSMQFPHKFECYRDEAVKIQKQIAKEEAILLKEISKE